MNVHSSHPTRHLAPPNAEQLTRYAAHLNLELPAAEATRFASGVADQLAVFDQIDEVEIPDVPGRHSQRDPGRPPRPGEDPHNAIVRFCNVQGADTGPLAGWRIGVKDCIAIAGVPMTGGGRRRPVPVPTEDALVVERLLDAGATIAATTTMPDMALGLGLRTATGPVRNPRNPRYASGGSSSGSGAAVAAGLVDAALGADQGGSIRIPAAWCGIVGTKPTHGLFPTQGLTHVDHTLDHIGPMTATVADNAAMLEVIASGDWRDPHGERPETRGGYRGAEGLGIAGVRIGVPQEATDPDRCTAGTLDAFERALKTLTDLGAIVVPVSVPMWPHATAITRALIGFGLTAMTHSYGQGYGHFGRIDLDLLKTTATHYRAPSRALPFALQTRLLAIEHLRQEHDGVHFGKAQNLRAAFRAQVDRTLDDVDLLATPTTPTGPLQIPAHEFTRADAGREQGADAAFNTAPFNLTGCPALTLPSGPGDDELPTGLQIAGRRFDEHTVYRAAFSFEAASPGKGHR